MEVLRRLRQGHADKGPRAGRDLRQCAARGSDLLAVPAGHADANLTVGKCLPREVQDSDFKEFRRRVPSRRHGHQRGRPGSRRAFRFQFDKAYVVFGGGGVPAPHRDLKETRRHIGIRQFLDALPVPCPPCAVLQDAADLERLAQTRRAVRRRGEAAEGSVAVRPARRIQRAEFEARRLCGGLDRQQPLFRLPPDRDFPVEDGFLLIGDIDADGPGLDGAPSRRRRVAEEKHLGAAGKAVPRREVRHDIANFPRDCGRLPVRATYGTRGGQDGRRPYAKVRHAIFPIRAAAPFIRRSVATEPPKRRRWESWSASA